MRKIERLRLEALESCRYHGHDMTRFEHDHLFGHTACATCRVCGKMVSIDSDPPPNGIDIGGEAVALTCEGLIQSDTRDVK